MTNKWKDLLNYKSEPMVPDDDAWWCLDCKTRIGMVGVGPKCLFCGSENLQIRGATTLDPKSF